MTAVALLGIVGTSLVLWSSSAGNPSAGVYDIFLAWLVYYAYAFGSAFWFDFRSRLSLYQRASAVRTPGPAPPPIEAAGP